MATVLTRRDFLKVAALGASAAAAAFALAGCSKDDTANTTTETTTTTTVDNSTVIESAPGQDSAADKEDSGKVESAIAEKVVVAITADIPSLAPFYQVSMGGLYTTETIFEPLFRRSTIGGAEVLPIIGKEMKISGDATEIDVTMFDYVYDSAGNNITADDVVFSYNTKVEAGTLSTKYFESIEATGEYSVKIHVKNPALSTSSDLVDNIFIVSQKAYDETAFNTAPVGTGVYEVEEFVSGSYLKVVKRDDYWQTDLEYLHPDNSGNVEHITYKIILEAAQVAIALQAGDVDLTCGMASDELPYFEDPTKYTINSLLSNRIVCLSFSMQSPVVADDINLRKAILYAVDNAQVMAGVVGQYGEVGRAYGISYNSDWQSDWETWDYYNYNEALAKEYLEKSNYKANGSPVLRIFLENNADRAKVAQMIQGFLLAVGIQSEINQYDSALFSTYKYEYDEWDICLDNYAITFAACGAAFSHFTHTKEWNGIPINANQGWHDDHMEELAMAASGVTTHSPETVKAAQEYLRDQAVCMVLYIGMEFQVAQAGITHIAVNKKNFLCVPKCTFAPDFKSTVV